VAELTIQAYTPSDRSEVFRIAADTAFFGEPVEVYLDDRRLFCDIFYRYYTDLENEHSLIACAGDEVAGFLMGSVDTAMQQKRWYRETLLPTLWQALKGSYKLGTRTWRYLAGMALASLRREYVSCDLTQYPAHLHINIDKRWRGRGFGRRLMQGYLDHLRSLGVVGVHMNTTSFNEAACILYERMGFELLAAHPTHLWAGMVDQAVENRCYGLKLR
jgi:ribosomal protein S18 acetylase RimI-like enzyme